MGISLDFHSQEVFPDFGIRTICGPKNPNDFPTVAKLPSIFVGVLHFVTSPLAK